MATSSSVRKDASYGALEGPRQALPAGHLALDIPLKSWHRRINIPALLEALIIPWALYFGVLTLVSSEFHYKHQLATDLLALSAGIVPAIFAVKGVKHQCSDDDSKEPSWYPFLAVACTLAWLLSLGLGYSNYYTNISPYYDITEMGSADNVDPFGSPGAAYLGVSQINFAPGTQVSTQMSLGFKDGDVYCVAPIVSGNMAMPPATYDYWAVGINCCLPNPPPAHFWCGGNVGNLQAHSGILWTQESQRPFFRLAIQMAQVQYNITAGSLPLYFTWTQDPSASTAGMLQSATSNYRTYVIFSILLFGLAGLAVAYRARQLFQMEKEESAA